MSLDGRPSDYIFHAGGILQNVHVNATFFNPVLSFQFENFHLIKNHTQKFILPPSEVNLTFFQAFILRGFFSSHPSTENSPPHIYPIMRYEGQDFAIELKAPKLSY